MMRRFVLLVALLACSVPALAQQRPLQTEDPETVGAGRILLELGVGYERDIYLPVSGLRGDVTTVPEVGISIGVSSIAEIQLDAGLYQQMRIKDHQLDAPFGELLTVSGNTTHDVEDLNIGAKIRFLSETASRPAMAFRFSTRLPNASNEAGLGKDVQDFGASLAFAKTIQSVRTVANVGFLILGNPLVPAAQDDLLSYSLSVARAISPKAEMVGEFVGRANFANIVTPGAEDRGLFRFGTRFTQGSVRLDAGVIFGLTNRDPEIGATAGLTWVFNAFKVP
jgi:hypothetical protein